MYEGVIMYMGSCGILEYIIYVFLIFMPCTFIHIYLYILFSRLVAMEIDTVILKHLVARHTASLSTCARRSILDCVNIGYT